MDRSREAAHLQAANQTESKSRKEMRKKKVWRYYCDFCKKANCHGGAMKEHEAHCTNNPNRICRMCEVLETRHTPLEELVAILPDANMPDTRTNEEVWRDRPQSPFNVALAQVFPLLRKKADGCPVCIFAALRQAKIPADRELFDLKAKCNAVLEERYRRE